MGKYSHLKDNIVRFSQDQSWQEEIDKLKPELTKKSNTELSKHYSDLKDLKEDLEAKIKKLNTEIEACSQILVDRLDEDGIQSFKTDTGTFFIKDEPYSTVSDKQAFFKWVKDQGLEDLFTVHYQTMSGMVKERLLNGEELPPGISVYMKSSINRRVSKA
jgi:uncharacterized protein YaaN involved in tellurite resistance